MDIFQELNDAYREHADHFFIEAAVGINDVERTYTPGIQIEARETYAPLFFSSAELREMADKADEIAQKMVQGN